jgi:uncharacterized protein
MVVFFALALLFTWPLQFAAEAWPALWLPFMAVAGLGPSLAAIVVTRGAVLKKLRRGAPAPLLLVSFLTPFALLLAAGLADGLVFTVPFWGAVIWPPFGEELGWRGYLNPALAARHGARLAAVGTGLAWAIWHIPTGSASSPLYAVSIVAWSLIIAYLTQRGRGSVWIGILVHAGINAAAGTIASDRDALRLGLMIVVAGFAYLRLSGATSPARSDAA